MPRITVTLSKVELDALINLAGKEFRHPRLQAKFIICQALEKEGLIETAETALAVSAEVLQDSTEKEIKDRRG